MIVSMKVDPGDQLALNMLLGQLAAKVYQNVVGRALTAAATPLVKDIRRRIKGRGWSRDFARSIGRRQKKYRRAGVVHVSVGPRRGFGVMRTDPATGRTRRFNASNIAHLVEYGTRPHRIRMPSGKTVMHPGSRPQPTFRPAFASQAPKVLRRYREYLWRGVLREARKLGNAMAA